MREREERKGRGDREVMENETEEREKKRGEKTRKERGKRHGGEVRIKGMGGEWEERKSCVK